eukprot:m.76206 g.76206  ORF g.76206 m.76206 type:complete len:272 (+) comp13162_c0_seq2:27-842(+)
MTEEYVEGERILCFHNGLLYEARILKAEVQLDGTRPSRYRVHYNKWNKKWDEWVTADRMRKYNEENLAFKKHMEAATQVQKEDPAKSGAKRKGEEEKDPRKQKEGARVEIDPPKLVLPPQLKRQLVDDYHFIVTENRLVTLPRTPNVAQILTQFREANAQTPVDWLKDFEALFCVALGTRLLYPFERVQYLEALQGTPLHTLCELYGAEHLLRFLLKLPEILAEAGIMLPQREHVDRLLAYLDSNFAPLFMSEYDNATPSYMRAALYITVT